MIFGKIHKVFLVLLGLISLLHAFQALAFFDLPADHRNKAAIEYLQAKNIVKGYEDGLVRPDQDINRAEALKVMLEAVDLDGNGALAHVAPEAGAAVAFGDVTESDWFYDYIKRSFNAGIVKGYDDNTFKPASTVNLAEALKMIILTFDVSVSVPTEGQEWYQPYLTAAFDRNLIELQADGLSHPEKTLSRGELFEIIYRAMYIRENHLSAFDVSLNWPTLEMARLNFQVKYPFDFQIIKNDHDVTIWHQDKTNNQMYYLSQSPLGAYMQLVLNGNQDNVSSTDLFKSLSNNCLDNCKQTMNGDIPTFVKINETNTWFSEEQYLYLPNQKFLILYIGLAKDKLNEVFLRDMNAMIASLKYVPDDTIDDSNVDEILSTANQNIQVDGKGQETLALFVDAVIIETDPIGVGAGPVDYYYSAEADVTLKYLRQYDTILDIETGRTSDF
ncbi:MAG: hypothetical protein UR28_C0030G0013 [Candidatus Peregrinibacteria bacterium GW2011_GWF2_33_10]|nr:MAG: hypothetical protein UR28_C0030G0013 [Candidatus Peregrinibacteria bacterium GW2011_GWF2_33_10]OGJ45137.1 MAG: hypothetical protein A2263_05280 [Candidatus Peregrinibacteria bacterium RIFOXYA2_FULL_33_21]OGJ50806.1 MAG: hypothetical protein A2307_02050 [Candidatus Peregrinibacteria bacterium RIFOXYB2_FULL_33_20]